MSPQVSLRDLTPTEADLDDNTTTTPPKKHQTLREKATQALHGPDANPSQLGDPISLKAEASNTNPTPAEAGAPPSPSSSSASSFSSSSSPPSGGHEKLREKAAKELHGPGANPSLLGDPVSLRAEHVPDNAEGSAAGRRAPGRSRL